MQIIIRGVKNRHPKFSIIVKKRKENWPSSSRCRDRGVLGFNEPGELRVKGLMKIGDVVYYDKELCFPIINSIKELIEHCSWHVSPSVLNAVSSCSFCSYDGGSWIVILKQEAKWLTEQKIRYNVDEKVFTTQSSREVESSLQVFLEHRWEKIA